MKAPIHIINIFTMTDNEKMKKLVTEKVQKLVDSRLKKYFAG